MMDAKSSDGLGALKAGTTVDARKVLLSKSSVIFFPQQRPDNRPRHPSTSQDAFPNRQDVCELIALLCAEECRHSRFTRWSAAKSSATSILLKADRSPLAVKRLCTSGALECTVEVFGQPVFHGPIDPSSSQPVENAAVLQFSAKRLFLYTTVCSDIFPTARSPPSRTSFLRLFSRRESRRRRSARPAPLTSRRSAL